MLTIISPMEEELAGVRQALMRRDMQGAASLHLVGIGRDAIERNLKVLLPALRQARDGDESPSGLLLLGFAGAVDPSLSTGDLVLAGRYCHLRDLGQLLVRAPGGMTLEEIPRLRVELGMASGGFARYTRLPDGMASGEQVILRRAVLKFLEPDSGLWQRAKETLEHRDPTAIETDSMTVDQLVTDRNSKAELHRQYEVSTVNMEDYWVARLAAAAKVPFLSVRAVLDTAGQVLPRWVMGLSGRPGWASLNILSRPWQTPSLLELARQKRQAQRSLARFALAFIDHSGPSQTGAAPLGPSAPDPEFAP